MSSDDEAVASVVEDLAVQAGDLDVAGYDVEHRVRVRRSRRRFTAVAGAVGVLVTAGVVVSSLQAGRPGSPAVGFADPASPARTTAPSWRWDRPSVDCGRPLAQPLTSAGAHGLRLSITNVAGSGSPPAVTVRLSVTGAATMTVPAVTPLQVLLVKDGTIVDRLGHYADLPDRKARDWLSGTNTWNAASADVWQLKPAAPIELTVSGPGHCSADWRAVQSDPSRYTLVAVVSKYELGDQPAPPPNNDVLLVSDPAPLTSR